MTQQSEDSQIISHWVTKIGTRDFSEVTSLEALNAEYVRAAEIIAGKLTDANLTHADVELPSKDEQIAALMLTPFTDDVDQYSERIREIEAHNSLPAEERPQAVPAPLILIEGFDDATAQFQCNGIKVNPGSIKACAEITLLAGLQARTFGFVSAACPYGSKKNHGKWVDRMRAEKSRLYSPIQAAWGEGLEQYSFLFETPHEDIATFDDLVVRARELNIKLDNALAAEPGRFPELQDLKFDSALPQLMTNNAEKFRTGPKSANRWFVSDRGANWLFAAQWVGTDGKPTGHAFRADTLLYRLFSLWVGALNKERHEVDGAAVDDGEILALIDPDWASSKSAARRSHVIGLSI